jgi:AcrR family transcriptional regulator
VTNVATTDGRLLRGDRTRAAVLDRAMAMATEAGLNGLSLGQLAEALGVSKSGLFAHWKSKEELQLATIDHATQVWVERVVVPALSAPRGVRRLWALHQSRMDYYAADLLPGGCFFANTQFEFNARPGAVRDRLAEGFTDWMATLVRLAVEAVECGELDPAADIAQLAYEIEALGLTAVMQVRLLQDTGYSYARRAVLDRLRALCPDPALLPEEP